MVNWHPFFGTIWHPNWNEGPGICVFLMCRSNLKKGNPLGPLAVNVKICEMYQEVAIRHSQNLSGLQFPQTCTLWCPKNYSTDWHWLVAFCVENNALPQHSNCGRWKVFARLFLNQIWRFKLKKWIKMTTPFFSTVPHLHCCFRVCRDKEYRLVPSRKLTWNSQPIRIVSRWFSFIPSQVLC